MDQFFIEWRMNFSTTFMVIVDVQTSVGQRYLVYLALDYDWLREGQYIYYGLGADTLAKGWRTISRNLRDDLESAQPGVQLLEVNGFMIRGSGRIDDVRLMDSAPD